MSEPEMIQVFAVAPGDRRKSFSVATVDELFKKLLDGFDFAIVDFPDHDSYYTAVKFAVESEQRAAMGAQIAGTSSPFFKPQSTYALPNGAWRVSYLKAQLQQQVQQQGGRG